MYSWGKNSNENLIKVLDFENSVEPKQVLIYESKTIILQSTGQLFACKNKRGNLKRAFKFEIPCKINSIACSKYVILALDIRENIWIIENYPKNCEVRQIDSLTQIKQIACGYNHYIALDNNGNVYSWGSGSDGRLGTGNFDHSPDPIRLDETPEKIKSVACGFIHSVLISDSGSLYAFGFNGYGQLGLGSKVNASKPTLCNSLPLNSVLKVACGAFHTVVLCEGGALYSMGLGTRGQLGTGNCVNSLTPELIGLRILDLCEQTDIICGSDCTYVIIKGRFEMNNYSFSFVSTSESSERLESSYNITDTSFRPENLPPKDPSELAFQRKLIADQARIYLERVKEKERRNRMNLARQLRRESKIQKHMHI